MIKILNEANEAVIQLFGDIGQSFFSDGWTLEKFADSVNGLTASAVTIELKSNGGDAMEAFAIYDKIKSMPARVTVKVIGSSASAATIIASAADRVLISENSRYLVHNAQTFVQGSKETLKEAYDTLDSFDNQILNVYIKRTGKTREVLQQLMTEERWMTAQEALDWGFVDDIIKQEPKITNMKDEKIKNLTEEEQAAMDVLTAELEAMKAENEALKSKLAEYESAEAAKEEEEIEALVEAKIAVGAIKAEAKDVWMNFGRSDRMSMTAAIEAVYVPVKESLKDVPAKTAKPVNTKAEAWAKYRQGEYKTHQEYLDAIKNMED